MPEMLADGGTGGIRGEYASGAGLTGVDHRQGARIGQPVVLEDRAASPQQATHSMEVSPFGSASGIAAKPQVSALRADQSVMMLNQKRTSGGSRDIALGLRGRLAFIVACGGCCLVPVLIIVGAISIGSVLGGGAAVGGIAVLAVVTHRVVSNRVGQTSMVVRLSLAATGIAAAVAGLLGAPRFLLVLGITGLGIAALLALSYARGEARDHCG